MAEGGPTISSPQACKRVLGGKDNLSSVLTGTERDVHQESALKKSFLMVTIAMYCTMLGDRGHPAVVAASAVGQQRCSGFPHQYQTVHKAGMFVYPFHRSGTQKPSPIPATGCKDLRWGLGTTETKTYAFYRLKAIYTKRKRLTEQCCFLDKSSIAFGQDKTCDTYRAFSYCVFNPDSLTLQSERKPRQQQHAAGRFTAKVAEVSLPDSLEQSAPQDLSPRKIKVTAGVSSLSFLKEKLAQLCNKEYTEGWLQEVQLSCGNCYHIACIGFRSN
ncbi:hypothetical protein Anapl_02455 [Anas platyrhynchos]|uniref:Uncharacterized protein n=1 Tax=Anas platyrhynchos TaxID=8839 RepID=R0K125_ANAPL|nr:hypothetical protein Anapl_02455 [Anas platyrhynchos]